LEPAGRSGTALLFYFTLLLITLGQAIHHILQGFTGTGQQHAGLHTPALGNTDYFTFYEIKNI
jgi:hypothetical protein